MQPRRSTPSRPPRAPDFFPTQPSYPPPDSLLVEADLVLKYMTEMTQKDTELEEKEQQEQQDKSQDATEDEDSVDDATEEPLKTTIQKKNRTRGGVRKKSFKSVSNELDSKIEEALFELRQPPTSLCPTV